MDENLATAEQGGASIHDRLMSIMSGDASPPEDARKATVEDAESTGEVVDEDAAGEIETEDTDVADVDEAEVEEDSPWRPESAAELAEALEIPIEDVLKMRVQTKVDGQVGEATLEEVIKTHQLEKHLTRRSEALAKERKEWEQQAQKQREEYEAKVVEAAQSVASLEQLLVADYQAINWQELREEDQTEYLIKSQEMQNRFAQLQAVKNQLVQRHKAEAERLTKERDEMFKSRSQEEFGKLQAAIPEWQDSKRFNEGFNEVLGYIANDMGFTPEEWGQVIDHRAYVMARKAMLYDRMQSKVEPKKQQLKQKPKFVPPGARKPQADAKARKIAELKKRQKRGDRAATHELLMMKFSKK